MSEPACQSGRDQFGPYLYGELGPTDVEALRGHLATCAACRREFEAVRAALAAVDRAGLASVPRVVVERVTAGALAAVGGSRRRLLARRWPRAVASLAACLTLAALGVWAFMPTGDQPPVGVSPNRELELATAAVATDARAVLRLADELRRENDVLVRLMGGGGTAGGDTVPRGNETGTREPES